MHLLYNVNLHNLYICRYISYVHLLSFPAMWYPMHYEYVNLGPEGSYNSCVILRKTSCSYTNICAVVSLSFSFALMIVYMRLCTRACCKTHRFCLIQASQSQTQKLGPVLKRLDQKLILGIGTLSLSFLYFHGKTLLSDPNCLGNKDGNKMIQ